VLRAHLKAEIDGQKIQFAGVANLVTQMPDRLRAEVVNDRHERLYLYDGKTFTLWARRVNYYASVPAPPIWLGGVQRGRSHPIGM